MRLAHSQRTSARSGSGQPDIRISAVPSLDQLERPKQIFVLTQERLSSLLSVAPDDMSFDIVVVDEAQNIADDARGMILQDCLERIAQTHQLQLDQDRGWHICAGSWQINKQHAG